MGKGNSKETKVDTAGAVNNNIILQEEPINIHNPEIVVLLYIICVCVVLNTIFKAYRAYTRHQKKKYIQRGVSMAQL